MGQTRYLRSPWCQRELWYLFSYLCQPAWSLWSVLPMPPVLPVPTWVISETCSTRAYLSDLQGLFYLRLYLRYLYDLFYLRLYLRDLHGLFYPCLCLGDLRGLVFLCLYKWSLEFLLTDRPTMCLQDYNNNRQSCLNHRVGFPKPARPAPKILAASFYNTYLSDLHGPVLDTPTWVIYTAHFSMHLPEWSPRPNSRRTYLSDLHDPVLDTPTWVISTAQFSTHLPERSPRPSSRRTYLSDLHG